MPTDRWTAADIPSQSGRTIVVTGANTGLGLQTARSLAEHGATVVLACRDMTKAGTAAQRIRADLPDAAIEVAELDLGSLDAVRAQAAAITGRFPAIDVLVNNAGVMYPPLQRTADGFELQLGTNHLGPFVLTGRLLPALRAAPGSRIVTVASIAHTRGNIDLEDPNYERRGYNRVGAYGQSKLANLLFARELDRRLRSAAVEHPISVAAHPGVATTELTRHLPRLVEPFFALGARLTPLAQSPAQGALPQLRAATGAGVEGGDYWGPDGFQGMSGYPVRARSTSRSRDPELARALWDLSERLTGEHYALAPDDGGVPRA